VALICALRLAARQAVGLAETAVPVLARALEQARTREQALVQKRGLALALRQALALPAQANPGFGCVNGS
jgi:hypothetical protein